MSNIRSNVEAVRSGLAQAARRSGRDPAAVTIIAVTKTRTLEETRAVLETGITDLGENRIQELKEKAPHIAGANWHLIGSLQTNKVKSALELASLIHALDRIALADEIAKQAERSGTVCRALVQVNVSGEESKHGASPSELIPLLRHISERGVIKVEGLMTMAPLADNPEAARPHFRRLRELADEVRALGLPQIEMNHLSMGMSGDYAVAVEEGATLVRIGTALFGART